MATDFEKIKNADQLKEYLKKHAAADSDKATSFKSKNVSPTTNDYVSMKQMKAGGFSQPQTRGQASSVNHTVSDRYENRSSRRQQAQQEAEGLEDEKRSLQTELDYSRKDASRHIVSNRGGPDSLRQKLLRNLEGVRKNKPILRSDICSIKSIRSRASGVSARASQTIDAAKRSPLTQIEEAEVENCGPFNCECCPDLEVNDDEDLQMLDEINKSLPTEVNYQKAYNDFRVMRGKEPIDFTDGQTGSKRHKVQLCIDCLLECFQAKRAEKGDIELDEVSGYRGSIMQGIGMTPHGRYPRKLGDELGIPRKKFFGTTQHGASPAFQELAIPPNKETVLNEVKERALQDKAEAYKRKVSDLSRTQVIVTPSADQPAGSRVPKPFKKTYADKMPDWVEQGRKDGKSDDEINDLLHEKALRYIDKWGNHSCVGQVINSTDKRNLSLQPRNQAPMHRTKGIVVGTPGRAGRLPSLEQRFGSAAPSRGKSMNHTARNQAHLRSSARTNEMNILDGDRYRTTNQSYYETLEHQDFSAVKRNFKKKTPFTQWSNAYFSGGVFFNPPVSGI